MESQPKRRAVTHSKLFVGTFVDGLARLVDISPPEIVVFSEDSDWTSIGGDFRSAIDTLIASDQRLQPSLPFEDDELVEAK